MTITIEIDKDKDASALKDYLSQSGYKFEIDEDDDFVYSDQLKYMLDQREDEYLNGQMPVISAEESKRMIQQILEGK